MLTLVPTPIGNLDDISSRVLQALRSAELFLCEDTRVTKKLLSLLSEKYNTSFPCSSFQSFHHHNDQKLLATFDVTTFKEKNIVYVSDAGMPCISDPGATLVDFCIQHGINYDVLPGPNAVLTAYAMSGFNYTTFTFFGFLPHKGKERAIELAKVLNSEIIPILYESPHRLLKLLEELNHCDENRVVFLAKELTKKYQTTFKATAKELYEHFKKENIKGEWVVVIEPIKAAVGENITLTDIQELDLPPKQKAKLLSKMTGRAVKEIYQELLDTIHS
ncbi:MAG: 16S rRNA (cytidine(1402)-2'-O)-methyltransferase [Candidatus Marinarcus sp.]|uniref:16S rRNA (cytidine(1402)-2'-O)-methyltransferase n=1 Tax=Candidatus Marinarcus sp. TaxID=3100987 RepID=UPI003AFFE374